MKNDVSNSSARTRHRGPIKNFLIAILQVVGYILAYVFVTILLMVIIKILGGDWEIGGTTEVFFEGLFTVISVAIIFGIMVWGFKSRLAAAGWSSVRGSFRGFWIGSGVGFATAVGMLVLTLITGGGRMEFDPGQFSGYLVRITILLGVMLVATLGEEWLFRGYPLSRLSAAMGRGWANLFMAMLFSVAHFNSEGYSVLVAFNIVIGGLIVGSMRFTSGGVAAAWGFHFAWNSTQLLFGSTLTGLDLDVPMVRFISKGPVWISGGALGPEGGIGATISTIVVLFLLGMHFRKHGARDLPIPMSLAGSPDKRVQ